jgi:hypothetical protein
MHEGGVRRPISLDRVGAGCLQRRGIAAQPCDKKALVSQSRNTVSRLVARCATWQYVSDLLACVAADEVEGLDLTRSVFLRLETVLVWDNAAGRTRGEDRKDWILVI